MIDFSGELNPEQFEAATWTKGPLLILAGAGSGKTRVLIYRMMHLAANLGIDPSNVLAVTFTNKAAGEMRTRLAAKVDPAAAKRAWIHTFHGACLRILRREIEGRIAGFTRDFGIFDDDDQLKMIKPLLAKAKVSETLFSPRSMLSRIHDAKNKMVGPEEFGKNVVEFSDEAVSKVYPLYQRALRENNAVDFDDILIHAVELIDKHPDVRERLQARFKHILVDEYQDTNRAQYRFVTTLAASHRNLAVVGDDDQGIYAWRGADIQNILDFQKDYPDAKVVKLERNYRSTRTILAAAMGVISKNRGRLGKTLWTQNDQGASVKIYEAGTERDESRWICDEILRMISADLARRDVAIFYRTNAQSRALEEGLRARGIPYRMVGALKFFDRAEIKDTIAYLKSIVNPLDTIALTRILNVPPRGIGDTSVERLQAFAESRKIPLHEAVTRADEVSEIKPATRGKIREFGETMTRLREEAKTASPAAFLRKMVEETGYLPWLKTASQVSDADDPLARVENVGQLIASAGEYSAENPEATPSDFLDQVSLVSDVDDLDITADAVTLMTYHAAKGLEFPLVFMTGMEDGIFPHSRAIDGEYGVNNAALEEERRLCYVGMTRARKFLYLTYARERSTWGARRPLGASRFLADLPPDIAEIVKPRGGFDNGVSSGGFPRIRARNFGEENPRYEDDFDQSPAWDDDASPARKNAGAIPPARGGASTQFKRGMRVIHTQFGAGEVRDVEGGGNNVKLEVAFENGGVRKLLLRYAGKDLRIAD